MAHEYSFFKPSGIRQVVIASGEDVANLGKLDPKLWTVLSSSVKGLVFDKKTLDILDSDKDGRIRIPEVLAAIDYLASKGIDFNSLFGRNELDLAALAKVEADLADLAKAEPTEADKSALATWQAAPSADPAILAFGDSTAAADAALAAVEPTIDAFFAIPDDLPLVTEEADKVLPLTKTLNPKFSNAVKSFAAVFAAGAESLDRSAWAACKAKMAPYRAWMAAKPVAAADTKAKLEDAEKTLRLKLNLGEFLVNYVNQAKLYDCETTAIYQVGTLYIDTRACSLCFEVANEGAHAALAAKSNCCCIYVKLTRSGAAPRTVCAVITAGTTGYLFVGRNGMFIDREGKDWDAVITKVVEAQVSLREAFWYPWKKLFGTVADQIKGVIAKKQEASFSKASSVATTPPAQQGANSAAIASSVAALSVGIGMLGAAFAGLVGFFAGLEWWKSVLGVLIVFLMVSVPSVILTWFKLRSRDLGAILNAGGWAVNKPLRFSQKLARTFTSEVR